MQKGRSSMGHSKHRKCGIHGHPVSEYVKASLREIANKPKQRLFKTKYFSSIFELMKERKQQ
jgi:hypothetical protein